MEKQLKVSFFGIKPPSSDQEVLDFPEWFSSIGIRTYTMGVEMALDIIRNSQQGKLSENDVPGLPPPENEYEISLGGRFFPFFSREEIVKLIGDVDLLILSGGLDSYYARGFLMWIDPEVLLSKKCTIVLRMPFTQEEASGKSIAKPTDILKDMGMNENGEAINKKTRRKLKKKNKKTLNNNPTIFIIGLEEYGGCLPEDAIPLLQAHLLQDGIVEQLVQPVKETVSAGKSLFNLGSTFTGWLSRLVKTN